MNNNSDIIWNSTSILIGISIVGILITLFFKNSISSDGSTGPAIPILTGYSLAAFSLLAIIVLIVSFSYKTIDNTQTKSLLSFITSNGLPVLLLVFLIGFIIYQNAVFFKLINQGKLQNVTKGLVISSTILVSLQIFLIGYYIVQLFKCNLDSLSCSLITSPFKYIVILLTAINAIIVSLIQIKLVTYPTDG